MPKKAGGGVPPMARGRKLQLGKGHGADALELPEKTREKIRRAILVSTNESDAEIAARIRPAVTAHLVKQMRERLIGLGVIAGSVPERRTKQPKTTENLDLFEGGAQSDEQFMREYEAACHAQQSAVAQVMQHEVGRVIGREMSPAVSGAIVRALKHLRVGVNNAMADQGALARLLIEKGLITHEEYQAAVLVSAKAEAESNARAAREKLGWPANVTFG